jgi:hypothetical protein
VNGTHSELGLSRPPIDRRTCIHGAWRRVVGAYVTNRVGVAMPEVEAGLYACIACGLVEVRSAEAAVSG